MFVMVMCSTLFTFGTHSLTKSVTIVVGINVFVSFLFFYAKQNVCSCKHEILYFICSVRVYLFIQHLKPEHLHSAFFSVV